MIDTRKVHDPAASDRMTQMRDPFVGAILDRRFRVDEKIAAGGFGAIYRATHVRSNHQVALKILHPRMAQDERIVARFRREGATLTSLRSQYTVATYELVEDSGTLFIVMELLRGLTLQQVFQQTGRLPWQRVARIGRTFFSKNSSGSASPGSCVRSAIPSSRRTQPASSTAISSQRTSTSATTTP